MGVCFCFHLIYGKAQILGDQALYNVHHLDLLTLPYVPSYKSLRGRGVQELSSFPDTLKAVKRMSLAVCLLEWTTHWHSEVERALCKASSAAWRVGTTDNIFLQSVRTFKDSFSSGVHTYLTLCRVWSRFRFLSSSNFLFSILASKLASSEATLLSRSLVFWTCACV